MIRVKAIRFSTVAAAAAIAFGQSSADAMDFRLNPMDGTKQAVISAVGEIEPGDDEKLHRFVGALPASTVLVGIALNSPGGNLSEGVRLAATVRNSGLRTEAIGTCASACFLVFAAGTTKHVFSGAKIG